MTPSRRNSQRSLSCPGRIRNSTTLPVEGWRRMRPHPAHLCGGTGCPLPSAARRDSIARRSVVRFSSMFARDSSQTSTTTESIESAAGNAGDGPPFASLSQPAMNRATVANSKAGTAEEFDRGGHITEPYAIAAARSSRVFGSDDEGRSGLPSVGCLHCDGVMRHNGRVGSSPTQRSTRDRGGDHLADRNT